MNTRRLWFKLKSLTNLNLNKAHRSWSPIGLVVGRSDLRILTFYRYVQNKNKQTCTSKACFKVTCLNAICDEKSYLITLKHPEFCVLSLWEFLCLLHAPLAFFKPVIRETLLKLNGFRPTAIRWLGFCLFWWKGCLKQHRHNRPLSESFVYTRMLSGCRHGRLTFTTCSVQRSEQDFQFIQINPLSDDR